MNHHRKLGVLVFVTIACLSAITFAWWVSVPAAMPVPVAFLAVACFVIGFFHNRYERALKETMEQNVLVHDMLRSLTSSSEIAEFVFSHMVMRLRKAPEHHKDLFVDVPRDVLARLDAYIHAQLGLTRDAFAGGGTKGSSDYRLAGKQLAELEKLLAVVRSEIDKNVTVGSCPDDCGPFVS